MTNFDFLTADPQFDTFSPVAVSAEKILHTHPLEGMDKMETLKKSLMQKYFE